MAEQLGAERVRLGAPVRRIEHGDGRRRRPRADAPERESWRLVVAAQRAIVAVPPTLAGRIAYDPPLPAQRDQLTQRMPQGTVIKTMAIYERAVLARGGPLRPGDQRRRPGPRRLRQLAAGRLARASCSASSRGACARQWGARDAAERRDGDPRRPRPPLRRAGGAARALHRAGLGRGGVDPRLLRLPDDDRRLDRIRPRPARPDRPDPLGRAETATVWNGYMDGAVQSGERAAAEVLSDLDHG